MMNTNKTKKRIIVSLIVVAVLALLLFVILYFVRKQQDKASVEVTPVSYLATENWNDEVYSSGQASSDYVQELYPDSQKIISEIFVQEGQAVKIGDPLIQYDKTLLELDLQRKQLDLQSIDENIRIAQNDLVKLKSTVPYVPPVITPEPEPTPVPTPTPIPPANVTVYSELTADSVPYAGKGTADDPYLYLCTPDCVLTKSFLRKVFAITDESSSSSESSINEETSSASSENPEETSSVPEPTTSPKPQSKAFVAVMEVREENSNFGELIHSFKLDGLAFSSSFSLDNPTNSELSEVISDFSTDVKVPLENLPAISDEPQYTAEELKQAIASKEAEIKTLLLSRKQGQLNVDKASHLVSNTTVSSTIEGIVRSLITIDEATANSQPFLVVSGENTFYLHGTINESLLGNIKIGDTINVNSWETGMYSAQIVSISAYPLDNDMYGYGGNANPNSSTYEFTAVFDDTEGIYNGMYFDITINASSSSGDTSSFYLEKMYIRDDDSGSYVMKKGEDNRLAKQYIQTGKTMSGGYYIEIKSGLTMEDSITFPYGKNLREGMRTRPQGTDEDYQEEEVSSGNTEEPAPNGGKIASDDFSNSNSNDMTTTEEQPEAIKEPVVSSAMTVFLPYLSAKAVLTP